MSEFLKKTFDNIMNVMKPKNETPLELIADIKKNPKSNILDADFIEHLSLSVQNNTFKLPLIPDIITQLMKLTNNERASFKMFSDIIKKDPLITLKILQLANSSMYKGNYEITDIEQAISRIGIAYVQSFVISIKLKNIMFNGTISQYFASILWKKSLLTAIIMGKSIKKINETNDVFNSLALASILNNLESSYYTLGLLHNVGAFITLSIGGTFIKEHSSYLAEEHFLERVVNSFEKQITKFVLTKWSFDSEQINAIDFMENKKKDDDLSLHKTIYFAHQISKGILSGQLKAFTKEEILVFYEKVNEDAKLNISSNNIAKILSESFKEFQTIIEMN